jgi:UDP-N-acetylmuramate--alanine ligase
LAGNAHAGKGDFFVIEADEYDRMFLGLKPQLSILTNVEYDHPDCYPTPTDYVEAFADFTRLLPSTGILVTNADDSNAAKMVDFTQPGSKTFTYGLGEKSHFRAMNLKANSLGGFDYDMVDNSKPACPILAQVSLQIPGEHNVRNSMAVLTASLRWACRLTSPRGISLALPVPAAALKWLEMRMGSLLLMTTRIIHQDLCDPECGAQPLPRRRLVAVWQPHTYSRTRALADDFIKSLRGSDLTLVTEIYAAREPAEAFSSAELVAKMQGKPAFYCKTLDDAVKTLEKNLQPGDVLLVLSAGDADQICTRILQILKERKH